MFRPSLWGFITGPDPYTTFNVGDGSAADLAYTAWLADGNVLPLQSDPYPNRLLQRNSRITDVSASIAALQDLSDAGAATADELALLATCKQYRIALYRVDLSATAPAWPVYPLPF